MAASKNVWINRKKNLRGLRAKGSYVWDGGERSYRLIDQNKKKHVYESHEAARDAGWVKAVGS